MRMLFGRELDETFRSDKSLWKKMGGAAIVSAFCVLLGIRKSRPGNLPLTELFKPTIAIVLALTALAGASLALMLSLKDVVVRRVGRGEPVNPILRLYFGFGIWSLVAWFPTIFVLGFLTIGIIASL